MDTSSKGKELTKSFEGLRLKAYPDPGTGGKPWTIGYGHTKGVKEGDVCTEEEADQWLTEDLKVAEAAVNNFVAVRLAQHQFDALVDFVFNVGSTAFKNSTLLSKLNAGAYERAAEQFLVWIYAAGKVLKGLDKRRKAERAMFLGGLNGS